MDQGQLETPGAERPRVPLRASLVRYLIMSGFAAQSIADAPVDRWAATLARQGVAEVPDLLRARTWTHDDTLIANCVDKMIHDGAAARTRGWERRRHRAAAHQLRNLAVGMGDRYADRPYKA